MQKRQRIESMNSLPQKMESKGHIVQLLRGGQNSQERHASPECSQGNARRSVLLPNIQNPQNSICYNQSKNIKYINEFFSIEQYIDEHPEENDSQLSLMKGIQSNS